MGFHYTILKASLNLKQVLCLPNLPKGSSAPISITRRIYVSRQPMQEVWLTLLIVTLGEKEFDIIANYYLPLFRYLTPSPQSLEMLTAEAALQVSL